MQRKPHLAGKPHQHQTGAVKTTLEICCTLARQRKIFISFNHRDRMQARGFRLLRFNKNVDVRFLDRNFIDPIRSKNKAYIQGEIGKAIKEMDAIVVLIGKGTKDSDWVRWEVEKAKEHGKGVLGIRLKGHEDCDVPWLRTEFGAKTIDWDHEKFNEEIDAAIRVAARVSRTQPGTPEC